MIRERSKDIQDPAVLGNGRQQGLYFIVPLLIGQGRNSGVIIRIRCLLKTLYYSQTAALKMVVLEKWLSYTSCLQQKSPHVEAFADRISL